MNANSIIYKQQAPNITEVLKAQSIIVIITIILAAALVYLIIQSCRAKIHLMKRCNAIYPINASTTVQLIWRLNRAEITKPEMYMGNISRYSVQCITLKRDVVQEKSLWAVFIGLQMNASMEEYIHNYKTWKVKEFIIYDLEKVFLKVAAAILGILLLITLLGSTLGNLSVFTMNTIIPATCIILMLQILMFKVKQQIIYKRMDSLTSAVLMAGIADENDISFMKREGKKRIAL